MSKTKIEWCDDTWNPVWGCKNRCGYCYARKMARRFGSKIAEKEFNHVYPNPTDTIWYNGAMTMIEYYQTMLENFEPIFLLSNLEKKFPGEGKKIFVNSMSDIQYWDVIWLFTTLNRIRKMPEHTFLFLTKDPTIYEIYEFPENCWLGVTVLNQTQYNATARIFSRLAGKGHVRFISIEPMRAEIEFHEASDIYIDWVIVGAETGNRKNKHIPKKRWIKRVANLKHPVFMKDNISKFWKGEMRREFPGELAGKVIDEMNDADSYFHGGER